MFCFGHPILGCLAALSAKQEKRLLEAEVCEREGGGGREGEGDKENRAREDRKK